MTWKDRCSFLSGATPTPHVVNGQTLNFYPVSVGALFSLKEAAKKVGAALAVLFASDKNDAGTTERLFAADLKDQDGRPLLDEKGKPFLDREVVIQAVSPELVALRLDKSSNAVSTIVAAFTEDSELTNLGRLVMDSLVETFPRGDASNPPPLEFVKTLSAESLVACLIGVAKANKGMFGPLGDRVGGLVAKLNEALTAKMAEIPGSPSKTNSSGSWSEATPSPGY